MDINQMPVVTITRINDDGKEARGVLEFKDWVSKFTCNTLERPWINNKSMTSCIPPGEYFVKWTFKLGKFGWIYEVQNVPNRSGILIHAGNYWYDSEGCILLGRNYSDINSDGEVDILNSKVTLKAFNDLLNKRTFKLIIK